MEAAWSAPLTGVDPRLVRKADLDITMLRRAGTRSAPDC